MDRDEEATARSSSSPGTRTGPLPASALRWVRISSTALTGSGSGQSEPADAMSKDSVSLKSIWGDRIWQDLACGCWDWPRQGGLGPLAAPG